MGINSKQVSRSQYMIQLKQHPQQQDPAERQASIHQKLCYTKFNRISLLLPSAFDWTMKEHITIKKKKILKKIRGTDVASCCDLQFLRAICGV